MVFRVLLDHPLSGVECPGDLPGDRGLMKELTVRLIERMPGAGLAEHSLRSPLSRGGFMRLACRSAPSVPIWNRFMGCGFQPLLSVA